MRVNANFIVAQGLRDVSTSRLQGPPQRLLGIRAAYAYLNAVNWLLDYLGSCRDSAERAAALYILRIDARRQLIRLMGEL
jgi:hypothetical protein